MDSRTRRQRAKRFHKLQEDIMFGPPNRASATIEAFENMRIELWSIYRDFERHDHETDIDGELTTRLLTVARGIDEATRDITKYLDNAKKYGEPVE